MSTLINTTQMLKDIIQFARKKPKTAVLIPSFLGGLWQLVGLLTVGFQYIRFFSPPQMLTDGFSIELNYLVVFLIYLFLLA